METVINHTIRAKLMLSLQEYTVMYFCEKNVGKDIRCLCEDEIAVSWENISSILIDLYNKGFLHNWIPTTKWTDEFVKKKSNKADIKRPSLKEVQDYFREKGYLIEQAKKAWEYYEAGDWRDRDGKPVRNWKQKMIANWMKDDFKAKDQQVEKTEIPGTGIRIYDR